MEAPDKIYIPINQNLDSGLEDFYVDHRTFTTDIEYIRKDALLECLEDIKCLIDRVNSL